jgi:hypothetical protein
MGEASASGFVDVECHNIRQSALRRDAYNARNDEDPLTQPDLQAIEARCMAASPGPWRSWIEGRDHTSGDSVITTGEGDIYIHPAATPAHPYDQDFIASARQDIPRLIAEIRRLRRLLGQPPDL